MKLRKVQHWEFNLLSHQRVALAFYRLLTHSEPARLTDSGQVNNQIVQKFYVILTVLDTKPYTVIRHLQLEKLQMFPTTRLFLTLKTGLYK